MESSTPFKRILIAIDADESSREAASLGFKLARWLGSDVHCIHAVKPPLVWPEMDEAYVTPVSTSALVGAREEVQKVVDRACEEADFEPGKSKDVLRVGEGERSKVVLETAEELGADLLVLGRRSSQSPFDFGSTTRAILAHSNLPTWVQVGPPWAIRRILVPIDFSDHSKRALDCAQALAKRFEASLEVFHCYAPPAFAYAGAAEGYPGPTYVIEEERKTAESTLQKWVADRDWESLSVSHSFKQGDITGEIARKAESADLVVMGTHGRTGLTRFLLGSIAYGVLKRSSCPVLVVPDTSREWLLGSTGAEEAELQKSPS